MTCCQIWQHGLGNFSSRKGMPQGLQSIEAESLGETPVNLNRSPGLILPGFLFSGVLVSGDPLSPGQQLAENVWPYVEKLDPEERRVFFNTLDGEWCRHCGCVHPGYTCQCNDDKDSVVAG